MPIAPYEGDETCALSSLLAARAILGGGLSGSTNRVGLMTVICLLPRSRPSSSMPTEHALCLAVCPGRVRRHSQADSEAIHRNLCAVRPRKMLAYQGLWLALYGEEGTRLGVAARARRRKVTSAKRGLDLNSPPKEAYCQSRRG